MLQKPSQTQRGRTRTHQIMLAKRIADQKPKTKTYENFTLCFKIFKNLLQTEKKYDFEAFSKENVKGK